MSGGVELDPALLLVGLAGGSESTYADLSSV